ncbi:MAG: type I-E CRISPR-associated protein Cas7/Cse4/CasC [Fimbriimonadaceae bacterium]|nr:MAG: CRISPR system Cascade subunit CasC [Armatimonadetes bacterium OLB18]WKZ80633.1 MAG: type I-E CRISPR-associated protein Cas7/Cse4/CasC [Fimbriimonadaceae bacterium]
MLIEVHIIQNHAPSNLNRDDSGSPKSAMFGGYRRARISSQCLKRCYRTSQTFRAAVDSIGMHTTSMPDEVLRRVSSDGVNLTEVERTNLAKALLAVVKKGEGGGGEGGPDSDSTTDQAGQVDKAKAGKEKLKTAQSVFWRKLEIDALVEAVNDWAKGDKKKEFDAKEALKPVGLNWTGIPVDMALFGRMVTSDLMHNVEASSQFAHAISTHEWQREFDLWTRVDDRRDKRLDFYRSAFGAEEKLESGTDGMGDAEFTSACYYSYFNVNFDALVDNLTGKALKHDLDDSKDREDAKKRACDAVAGLIKAAIFERPTGKFNSMASPSLPTLVLVEVRDSHVAVSYADAFAKPVDPKNEETQNDQGQIERVDLSKESAKRLLEEANRITRAFSRDARARYVFTGGQDVGAALENGSVPAEAVDSVDDLITNVRTTIDPPVNEANG